MKMRPTLFCLLAFAVSILPIWASESLETQGGEVGFAVGDSLGGRRAAQSLDLAGFIGAGGIPSKQNRDAIVDLSNERQRLQRPIEQQSIHLDPASEVTYRDRASCHRIENLDAKLTVLFPIFTADAWQNRRKVSMYQVGGAWVRVTPCEFDI